MRTSFEREEYDRLHDCVFRDGYPGYKPTVKEIPNGDGKVDAEKRFAHVAPKYLTDAVPDEIRSFLNDYLEAAHLFAETVSDAAGIPAAFRPDIRYGALRVLHYPPGAVSNSHNDFSLFTLMMFRDRPECFLPHRETVPFGSDATIRAIQKFNRQAHLGEIGEALGLGKATRHEVLPSTEVQRSIVYFAIPDHDAILPSGENVRDWLNERMARSRTEFKKYE